jgi:hypothetical protein
MKQIRQSARLIILLCLFVFQAQVMAGIWLSCKHVSCNLPSAGCPMHLQHTAAGVEPKVPSDHPFDCAKCILAVFVGVAHSAPSGAVVQDNSGNPYQHTSPVCFYYTFFPDRVAKPPQHPIA